MHSSLVLNMHSTLLLYIYQLHIHQSINYLLKYISVFRLISFSPGVAAITFSNLSNSGGELSAVSMSIIGDLALNLTSSPLIYYLPHHTSKEIIQLMVMTDEFRYMHSYWKSSKPEKDYKRKNLIYIINLVHHNN